MYDRTVIYYTSNKEDESFEAKIRAKLLESIGDLPLVSVSQKPLDFGTNICVGEVGYTYLNLFRQLLLGCEKATTPYIVTAESDCLYPKEYFELKPPRLDGIYMYDNVWLLKYFKHLFYRKKFCTGIMMAGREHFIGILKKVLEGQAEWGNYVEPFLVFSVHDHGNWEYIHGENPAITMKTGHGMRSNVGYMLEVEPLERLNYWGSAMDLKKEFGI
jgi:hypothetical protein